MIMGDELGGRSVVRSELIEIEGVYVGEAERNLLKRGRGAEGRADLWRGTVAGVGE